MAVIEAYLDVDVDANTAYERWSRIEDLPRIMVDVQDVQPTGDGEVLFVKSIDGRQDAFYAKVSAVPGHSISWRSTNNSPDAGKVTFEQDDPSGPTHVSLQIELDPAGIFDDFRDKLDV